MIKVDEKKNNKPSRLSSACCFAQTFWRFICVHLHSAFPHHSIPVEWMGADTILVLSFCGGFTFPTPARPGPRRRVNTQTYSIGVFLRDHSGLCRMLVPLSPPWGSQFWRASCPKMGGETPFCEGLLPCKLCVRPSTPLGLRRALCSCATHCTSAALHLSCSGHFLWTFCSKRRLAEFIGSYTPPERKRIQ